MKRKPAELDFETTLNQLETIVARLEDGDMSLEEALQSFEKGIQLAKQGQLHLAQAEQRIQILLQKNTDAELSDYQTQK